MMKINLSYPFKGALPPALGVWNLKVGQLSPRGSARIYVWASPSPGRVIISRSCCVCGSLFALFWTGFSKFSERNIKSVSLQTLILAVSVLFAVLRPIFKAKEEEFLDQEMSDSTVEIAGNSQNTEQRKGKKQRKLSHEELLRLLSVFEGELQARLDLFIVF